MNNYDAAEINKFDHHANDWWNPFGSLKTLHAINPLRMNFILQHIHLENKNVLDVGCGGGILTESLAMHNAAVTGIDMSAAAIDAAKSHMLESNLTIDYQVSTVEELATQKENCFEVITCMELLEHVPDPVSVIKSCSQLIKQEGYIYFSTINRTLKAYLFAILGAEYILQLLPKGTHDYDKFIRPSELSNWIRKAGLTVVDMLGINYNPLSKEYSLTKNVDVNYLICCKKC